VQKDRTKDSSFALKDHQMEKLEFACLFERLQNSLSVRLDSDIVSHIYHIYSHTYNNYSLFEIYGLLKQKNQKIYTDMMNWNILIDIAKKLDIPQKHFKADILEPMWYLMRDKDDIMSITLVYPKFEIVAGDLIRLSDGFTYEINEIYLMDFDLYCTDDEDAIRNDCMICLENIDTGDFCDMKGSGFIFELDCNDIQYIQSNWLDYVNK
jgi:hypothetical protein